MYSAKGLRDGQGRLTTRGDGGPCKNDDADGICCMVGDF